MPGENSKISKQKGTEMCADLLYSGKNRKEILQTFTSSYKLSDSTVDKWIKAARAIVEKRLEEDERIRARENEAAIVESAKRLNLTRERILEEYAKIAFFDIRKIFTVDGGLKNIHDFDDDSAAAVAGIESVDEKVEDKVIGTLKKLKITDKRAALDSICRVLGYNSAEKKEVTGKDGKPLFSEIKHSVTFKDFGEPDGV